MAKDTRGRILDATSRLLQQRGYHGTSLSEILQESGAPRGSLYFHFPGGKDQLVTEAARVSVERSTQWLRETFANMKDPSKGVRDLFATYAAIMRETDYTFGCLESAVVLDSVDGLSEVEELCRQSYEEGIRLCEKLLVEAGLPEVRARSLALLIEAATEGALILARACRNTDALLEVGAELEATIDGALRNWRETQQASHKGLNHMKQEISGPSQ